jgi:nitrile hydratase
MKGGQDLGGMHGLGPVDPEPDEPWFHAEWERRCFALTLAMGATGKWNLDMSRHARENRHPADYMRMSYYEIWLAGLERLLADAGLVEPGELDGKPRRTPAPAPDRVLAAGDVARVLAKGSPTDRPEPGSPRFAVGDRVRVRIMATPGHTRAPGYVHGRTGVVDRVHGTFVLPDANATGRGESPEPCYSVRFDARALWGDTAAPGDRVYADLWQSYLDPEPTP